MQRVRIFVSALSLVPWAVAFVAVGIAPALADSPWPVALAAGLPAAGVLAWRRRNATLVVLAFVLAAIAGFAGGRARQLLDVTSDDWPTFDLASAPLPDDPPQYVAVTGWFRGQWRLGEYAVPEGKLPDQSRRADAVLVPFVGSREDDVVHGGSIVVARVRDDEVVDRSEPTTIRGRVEPLADELLHTLVQVSAEGGAARGVLLDTLAAPQRREVWTNLAIAAIVALVAFACLWFATAPDPGEGEGA